MTLSEDFPLRDFSPLEFEFNFESDLSDNFFSELAERVGFSTGFNLTQKATIVGIIQRSWGAANWGGGLSSLRRNREMGVELYRLLEVDPGTLDFADFEKLEEFNIIELWNDMWTIHEDTVPYIHAILTEISPFERKKI